VVSDISKLKQTQLLFGLTNLVGAIGTVYSMAEDIAVKKDWTVVLAQGKGPKKLSGIVISYSRYSFDSSDTHSVELHRD